MAAKPLVSVVVPSLNQGEFIEETLISILEQHYSPLEVIVIDGGSTDDTVEILKRYGKDVQWTSEPDKGIADALNKGFDRAQGEIVGWLNSDDVYFWKDTVPTVVDAFEEQPEIGIVYGDVVILSRSGELLRLRLLPPYRRERVERSNMIAQPAVFMRASVIKAARPTDLLSLDYEYWLRLARLGVQFRHIDRIFAGDRQYPERLSRTNREQIRLEIRGYRPDRDHHRTGGRLLRIWDRAHQAKCRLVGLYRGLKLLRLRPDDNLAVSVKWPSMSRFVFRQLLRSITQVE